jgi:hypothetical protein
LRAHGHCRSRRRRKPIVEGASSHRRDHGAGRR